MPDDRTWLLIARKMANEASAQELRELEDVLRANPELYFSLQTLTDLWQQSPDDNLTDAEEAYSRVLHSMSAKGTYTIDTDVAEEEECNNNDELPYDASVFIHHVPTPFYKRTSVWATIVAVMAGIWLWMANPFAPMKQPVQNERQPISEISTRYGSKTNIVLPDGSKVWLNAGSKITYGDDFGDAERHVQLTGEAYFDVLHDASKPFIIHTKAMDIKVLGTEFNVKSYPDETTTETSLIRGSVEITLKGRKADRIVLKPNEKLVVSNEQPIDSVVTPKKAKEPQQLVSLSTLNYFSLDSTILETSWVENRLVFEDESFEEIATKMERWYGVTFEFKDQDIKELRFTGNFRNETINEALQAMQISASFNYNISDKKVTIAKH